MKLKRFGHLLTTRGQTSLLQIFSENRRLAVVVHKGTKQSNVLCLKLNPRLSAGKSSYGAETESDKTATSLFSPRKASRWEAAESSVLQTRRLPLFTSAVTQIHKSPRPVYTSRHVWCRYLGVERSSVRNQLRSSEGRDVQLSLA